MPSPQASSYQREATPPGPSFPNDNGSGSTIQRKREDGFIMAVKRAFSLDYYAPVPTVDEDVEAQRRHRHNNMVSTRRWAVLVALIGPFILLVLWIAKEHTTRSRSPLAAPHDDVENRNPAWDGTACGNVDGNDPVQALKAASTRTGLTQAAVAADHPVCSDLGLRVLEMGGNAVDAAVGVALCLGVANPASSGLGGGGFLLIHADPVPHERPPQPDGVTNGNNNKKKMPLFHDARNNLTEIPPLVAASGKVTEVIDCREIAPAAAETLMYEGLDDLASVRGGLAIGVPGELRGLELAHARHGRLAWAAVVGEVHRLADAGVPVNANLAHEIMIMYRRYHRNAEFPALRQLLTKNGHWSTVLKEGDVLRNPALTRLLADVRDHGANALYTGTHAAHLAADIQAAGGIVTVEDIENYRATLRSPVYAHGIRGYSLVGVPPPSSGGAAIVGAARFLAGYDDPLVATADTKATHRLVEAEKHAFAMRMSLADPAFDEAGVVQDAVQDLTRGDYMEGLRQASSDDTILPMSQYGGAKWAQLNDGDGTEHAEDADEGDRRRRRRLNGRRFGNLQDNGTSHFSIVDRDGNAVSMTTSVNTYFGSNVISPSTGVLLSNTMDDFSNPGRPNYFGLHPSESNYIKPGKKPLSSMSPTMVFETIKSDDKDNNTEKLGKLSLVLGASGGPKIISAVLQVFANHLLYGMNLFDAVVYPRVHDQLIYHGAAVCTAEHTDRAPYITLSRRTREALRRRDHEVLDVTYEGTVQAIAVDAESRDMTAVCDIRKGGTPAGV